MSASDFVCAYGAWIAAGAAVLIFIPAAIADWLFMRAMSRSEQRFHEARRELDNSRPEPPAMVAPSSAHPQ